MAKKIDLEALHNIGNDAPIKESVTKKESRMKRKEIELDSSWNDYFNREIKGKPVGDRVYSNYTAFIREAIYEKLVKCGINK